MCSSPRSGPSCSSCARNPPPTPPTPPSPDAGGDTQRDALALSLLPGVGVSTYHDLIARFGCVTHAFDATSNSAARADARATAQRLLERLREIGAQMVLVDHAAYPAALRDLDELDAIGSRYSPPFLFALGGMAALRDPIVAIVGTRRATPYGLRVARDVAGALAHAGATIVSGLARGIDAAAHTAALRTAGTTVAVLGTGVDIAYPASHRALHEEIAEKGLLLSEELPGEHANGGSFPKRNRIIAALAQLTIVIEAPIKSGALITANYAAKLGRAVAAVPGNIDAPQSAGSNLLLRDGAHLIADVDDALALIHAPPRRRAAPRLDTPAQRAVWDALDEGPLHVNLLVARTALPPRECLAAITALELAGVVSCDPAGEVRRA